GRVVGADDLPQPVDGVLAGGRVGPVPDPFTGQVQGEGDRGGLDLRLGEAARAGPGGGAAGVGPGGQAGRVAFRVTVRVRSPVPVEQQRRQQEGTCEPFETVGVGAGAAGTSRRQDPGAVVAGVGPQGQQQAVGDSFPVISGQPRPRSPPVVSGRKPRGIGRRVGGCRLCCHHASVARWWSGLSERVVRGLGACSGRGSVPARAAWTVRVAVPRAGPVSRSRWAASPQDRTSSGSSTVLRSRLPAPSSRPQLISASACVSARTRSTSGRWSRFSPAFTWFSTTAAPGCPPSTVSSCQVSVICAIGRCSV